MSFKKLTKCHPEKFTPANINHCRAFLNYMSTVPIGNLKFYDEARINVAMTNPVYGHAKKEERAVEIVKGRKGANWTLMLLCSQDGIDYAKLIEGACETFEYLRFLGEAGNSRMALRRNMFDQNDHLVLDNAGFHVGHNTAQIVSGCLRGKGAYLVFTPVYSPEFNAAELAFNYLKTMLKDSCVQNLALQNLQAAVYGLLRGISP